MINQNSQTQMIEKSFNWVVNNLDKFDPFKKGASFDINYGQKVCELAIMISGYIQLTGNEHNEYVPQIINILKTVQTNSEVKARLFRSPEEITLFCTLYGALRLLGHDNLQQRDLIQKVIDFGFIQHVERLPHRMMDILASVELGGFKHSLPSMETFYQSSILSSVPSALYLTEESIYALTHVILFLYKFGIEQGTKIPAKDIKDLQFTLSMLMIIACQDHHWDLLGELLWCWECIGLADNFIYQQSWQAFLQVQREDGAIPGPDKSSVAAKLLQNQEENNLDEQEYQEAYFGHHYHTTLVGIMAGSVRQHRIANALPSLKSDNYPSTVNRDLPATDESANNILAAINQSNLWLEDFLEVVQKNDHTPTSVFHRILLGSWISNSVLENTDARFNNIAQQVQKVLLMREEQLSDSSASTSSALKLNTAALLASENLVVPSLQNFWQKTVETLNSFPAANAVVDLPLCEKRLLLHALGFHSAPQQVDYTTVINFAKSLPLTAATADIEGLLLRINSLTTYGTQQITLNPGDTWLEELLSGFAMSYLRQYDLVMGCKVLRSMSYLGMNCVTGFQDCIKFLILHQHPEGIFGFFGVEETRLNQTISQEFVADRDLYLPTTISCLWTLAESVKGWSFYKMLPAISLHRLTMV
ncbi:hypothetical protein [Nostoc sp. TCL26-01]|uniref:DUF6895 family protein n=1 Tax=Nostoc sp. TCL26-01 TaxID=2576904 RepID=UPI0015B7F0EA|nr:hypothetical protein [Nostoc sp. TCL26-01]QLE54419.1 hypothetical protein FD725_02155 [Nostoc sp. TCL26-01]